MPRARATVFSAIRYGIPIDNVELPTAAVEHARRLAQRGTTVNALVRAYRLGHKAVLDAVLDEIAAYNRDDVESTLKLRDWLEERRNELGRQLGEGRERHPSGHRRALHGARLRSRRHRVHRVDELPRAAHGRVGRRLAAERRPVSASRSWPGVSPM